MQPAFLLILSCLLVLAHLPAHADTPPDPIPDALKPWMGWVLKDHLEQGCTRVWDTADRHRCTWPTRLDLEADDQGARFAMTLERETEGDQFLPGDADRWPQTVTLDGQPVLVIERNGRPVVVLPAGLHTLEGHIPWSRLPETLPILVDVGLLALQVRGEPVRIPQIDDRGRLWLRPHPPQITVEPPRDHLQVRVYRRLIEDTPFQVDTILNLEVAGQAREVILPRVLLPDTQPLKVSAPFPVRLETDGRLRAQIQPGRWQIQILARKSEPVEDLPLPLLPEPTGQNARPSMPADEIWSYQAAPSLRMVKIEGAETIDPRQAGVPDDWRGLPTYRIPAGTTLRLVTEQRGEADPPPDQLTLERDLWLDFDGSGFTLRDRLTGTVVRSARLMVREEIELGRVAINGEDQYLTHLPDDSRPGLEIREGRLELVADSRLSPEERHNLPASGWLVTPSQVDTTLHLPPAWRLLAAQGPDRVSGAWLAQWTLLDLFLVLVISIAFARLYGWPVGGLALITLALTYQEFEAPRTLWLHLLAAAALYRYFPGAWLVRGYRSIVLVALVLVALVFSVQQFSQALYPALPGPFGGLVQWMEAYEPAMVKPAPETRDLADRAVPQESPVAEGAARAPRSLREEDQLTQERRERLQKSVITDLAVQTGPGIPDWRWSSVQLDWSGPVSADQRLHLYLLPDWLVRLLQALGAVLVWVLLAIALRQRPVPSRPDHAPESRSNDRTRPATNMTAVIVAGLALSTGGLWPDTTARAAEAFPPPELLRELKAHLLKAPDCAPRCAALARMELMVNADELQLILSYHAHQASAVPLPLDPAGLHIYQVSLNETTHRPALYRDQGQLWLRIPEGRHSVRIEGNLAAAQDSLSLPLIPRPGLIQIQAQGWEVSGIEEGQATGNSLLIRRIRTADQQAEMLPSLAPNPVPGFVRVERTLVLAEEWRVLTRVERLSQADAPLAVTIPLLSGEHVTSAGVAVDETGSQVRVYFSPQAGLIQWHSTLERTDRLELVSPGAGAAYHEIWRLQASPLWHVEPAGIPPIHQFQPGGHWLPEWRPWPGEQVVLTIERPVGIEGRTLTIERSQLTLKPAGQLTQAALRLDIRSSQGGERSIGLPGGALVTGITLDGRSQPVKQLADRVILPVHPGLQSAEIHWRNDRAISNRFVTPDIDLGQASTNHTVRVELPVNRWLLAVGGPFGIGPAVRFWGAVVVLAGLALALALARRRWPLPDIPLTAAGFFLLGLGFLPTGAAAGLLAVLVWFLALSLRARRPIETIETHPVWRYNLEQAGLILLSIIAVSSLLAAVQMGLLGLPDMFVRGYAGAGRTLQWYADRVEAVPAGAWVVSLPLWVYRGLMLAWALWLAWAVLRWIPWGWRIMVRDGFLRKAARS